MCERGAYSIKLSLLNFRHYFHNSRQSILSCLYANQTLLFTNKMIILVTTNSTVLVHLTSKKRITLKGNSPNKYCDFADKRNFVIQSRRWETNPYSWLPYITGTRITCKQWSEGVYLHFQFVVKPQPTELKNYKPTFILLIAV